MRTAGHLSPAPGPGFPDVRRRPGRDDIGLFAARIAELHGYTNVLTNQPKGWGAARLEHPRIRVIPTTLGSRHPPRQQSALCLFDVEFTPAASGLAAARSVIDSVPLAVVAGRPDPSAPDAGLTSLRAMLDQVGAAPTFAGIGPDGAPLAVVDRVVTAAMSSAPAAFRVTAILTAYNEEDVIGATIQALVDGGIEVYVIDNWSTDRTLAIAESFAGRGLVGLERFPEQPATTYDWARLLERVEAASAGLSADWVIHHDADERRTGPWGDRLSLRDSLWVAQQAGFNAVDHTVLNFRPVGREYDPERDYAPQFDHFEFGTSPDLLVQVKAWRKVASVARLVPSGGHDATFPGRRVFPYKFRLQHYPIRSQAHGERKVLVDRRARWNAAERARGWHVQYDAVSATTNFVRRPEELAEWVDGQTEIRHIIPLLSGVGLSTRTIPPWATETLAGRVVYRYARSAWARLPETLRSRARRMTRRGTLLLRTMLRRPGR